MAEDWSTSEVNIIVADYFQMLIEEIKGSTYDKTEHRRSILPFLKNRSEQSVEFKHRNISAVLAKILEISFLGTPFADAIYPGLFQPGANDIQAFQAWYGNCHNHSLNSDALDEIKVAA
jgi:hypothetical protein